MIPKRLLPILFTFDDQLGGASAAIGTGTHICGRARGTAAIGGTVRIAGAIAGLARGTAAMGGTINTNCSC